MPASSRAEGKVTENLPHGFTCTSNTHCKAGQACRWAIGFATPQLLHWQLASASQCHACLRTQIMSARFERVCPAALVRLTKACMQAGADTHAGQKLGDGPRKPAWEAGICWSAARTRHHEVAPWNALAHHGIALDARLLAILAPQVPGRANAPAAAGGAAARQRRFDGLNRAQAGQHQHQEQQAQHRGPTGLKGNGACDCRQRPAPARHSVPIA